ncbi:PBP1A family penicillin-binding protein [Pelotomaculum terephthalicicum JT]|uniref:transglycosylase domain-containing protein n=1 Tax=Pelotomaculum terephthalicicum TaxID=206393 RepID=UPI0009C481C1|nr:PBP1A family penicillin-binding protein [Pelotomaculum terephthalicicum]MCG9967105.1 PBP1A family penicillin-binding protein [Pelotomaculum terephthalicicum JT]OPY63849.1 MAG: Penicillin-binding protein 1F [Pelotomaculum sp. PtaU1.Bin065]
MAGSWRNAVKVIAFIPALLILALTPVLIWGYCYANWVLAGFSSAKALSTVFDQNSFLYDENGNLICEIHGEINRTPVSLSQVPEHVQKAFVAIEDERFYSHSGVDIKAILRAAFSYYRSGRITEGASTITQQVIKLYFLSPEQTLRRKVREAMLALEFERRFNKDEILEFYLNRVYFGEGAYGIQSASKVYFNKNSSELTLAEGALLAALVQAPSANDPYLNPESAQRRRNVVLEKMSEQGYILKSQGQETQRKPVELNSDVSLENYRSYFLDYVMDEAVGVIGNDKIFKGGLKIYTTLEPEIQKKAEQVCARTDLFPSEKVEAAIAMVENGTGAVKAVVGGRQYGVNRGFNRATQLSRQPGSAFKPIAVYAPAFELGYTPDSVISDSPFKVGGYEPHNSGGGYYGPITIRTAVQWSRNVAAVRLLNQIGVDRGFEMAAKLGFELVEEDRCLPLALGGLTKGVSPLQMAGAYAAFPNGGVFIKPYSIKHIEDSQGQTLYRHPQGTPVMKASTADFIKDVLRAVVEAGTGNRAKIRGAQAAGKTGTTELPDTAEYRGLSGNKDAWFVGFTDRYTTAVWMGYDERNMDRQHYLTSYGGNQPAEIFRLVMAGVMGLDDRPAGGYVVQPLTEEQKAEQKKPEESDKQAEQKKQGDSINQVKPGKQGEEKKENEDTNKQQNDPEGKSNSNDNEEQKDPAKSVTPAPQDEEQKALSQPVKSSP